MPNMPCVMLWSLAPSMPSPRESPSFSRELPSASLEPALTFSSDEDEDEAPRALARFCSIFFLSVVIGWWGKTGKYTRWG